MPKALSEMRYGKAYAERVRLDDGTLVVLRLVRPDDAGKLLAGFSELSSRSRFMRFLSEHARLSEQELEYLTNVDQVDHFCIGAARVDERGREAEGVGIARFVRDPEKPEVAEAAVTVIDAWQRRGLGKILLARLAEAAKERDVKVFRTTLHASNEPVRRLLRGISSEVRVEGTGEVVTCEVAVPARGAILQNVAPWNAMRALFRILARSGRE